MKSLPLTGEQPFFYAMGFHKPHQPWDAPQEFFDLYPEDEIDLPSNPYVPEDMPTSAWSRFTGVLNFDDCSPEGTGIPNLGEANVTYPDSKIRELRRTLRVRQIYELRGGAQSTNDAPSAWSYRAVHFHRELGGICGHSANLGGGRWSTNP